MLPLQLQQVQGAGQLSGWGAGAQRGPALLPMKASLWSTGFGGSSFPILPALCHKESIYFSSVAGLPPLTWTLFVTAQTVWQVFGSLGLLQIIKYLQHLYFFIRLKEGLQEE